MKSLSAFDILIRSSHHASIGPATIDSKAAKGSGKVQSIADFPMTSLDEAEMEAIMMQSVDPTAPVDEWLPRLQNLIVTPTVPRHAFASHLVILKDKLELEQMKPLLPGPGHSYFIPTTMTMRLSAECYDGAKENFALIRVPVHKNSPVRYPLIMPKRSIKQNDHMTWREVPCSTLNENDVWDALRHLISNQNRNAEDQDIPVLKFLVKLLEDQDYLSKACQQARAKLGLQESMDLYLVSSLVDQLTPRENQMEGENQIEGENQMEGEMTGDANASKGGTLALHPCSFTSFWRCTWKESRIAFIKGTIRKGWRLFMLCICTNYIRK